MGMISNLAIKSPELQPGREMGVHAWKIQNHRFYMGLLYLAEMATAALEGDSNNQRSHVTPREIRDHWTQWEAYKAELEFARNHNDGPLAATEVDNFLAVPTRNEVQRAPNRKVQRVVRELVRHIHVCRSLDSARAQVNINDSDYKVIKESEAICEAAMERYWGTGKDNADTGVEMPDYAHMGRLQPDLDLDKIAMREPSADAPDDGQPDAPDTPVDG